MKAVWAAHPKMIRTDNHKLGQDLKTLRNAQNSFKKDSKGQNNKKNGQRMVTKDAKWSTKIRGY